MANKAMKERHWERIASLTGHTFDVESESFQLRNIMEAPLLEHKDDIEDICIAAVKEKDIEAKLKQVRKPRHASRGQAMSAGVGSHQPGSGEHV